jgi:predicted DNA-binding mobile mystery protein A
MKKTFKKLMREQVQESLNEFSNLAHTPTPKKGWITTIREALGMPNKVLAQRLGCSQANITAIERREAKKTITLETLDRAAQSMNCKLVYCLIPLEPLDEILKKQARAVAKKRIKSVNHSMKLELQGLNTQQLKQQEDNLVQELLQGNPKDLWSDDEA